MTSRHLLYAVARMTHDTHHPSRHMHCLCWLSRVRVPRKLAQPDRDETGVKVVRVWGQSVSGLRHPATSIQASAPACRAI